MIATGRGGISTIAGPMIKFVNGVWDNTAPISSITFELLYGSAGAFGATLGGGTVLSTYFSVIGSTL